MCGKNILKNQPCWLSEVRCGDVCGKVLRCGTHRCQKQCHRPGDCEEPCKQSCGKELSVCGHPCMAPCHFPSICKEDKPCPHKIFVTCECQKIKQESRCGASRQGAGNSKKTLKCDEECARLERNHKLALALNVDPEHQSDHVPYSAETLNMYQQNSTWAAAQEKQLRLFAADPEAKRLRFKPMQRHQRAFVHALAEDFGFDHESMDPEPHRHVGIFKTPRFVMAPMRTLAECARTRLIQRPVQLPPVVTTTLRPKPSNTTGDPYNAFLLTNLRFALTIEEVIAALKEVLALSSSFRLELEVSFLPDDAVALKPPLVARLNIEEREMQKLLESIQVPLFQAFKSQKIGKLELARLDSSLNVLRKESDIGPGSGWSQVAAAKSAPLRQVARNTPFGNKGGFAVLSLSMKKKKKPIEVAEDWEAAEEEEEEKEKVSDGNSAAMSENEEGGLSRPRSTAGAESSSDEAVKAIATKPSMGRWADLEDE
jgi:transcriptional repressor NF-X1